jgi:hypothetical protein
MDSPVLAPTHDPKVFALLMACIVHGWRSIHAVRSELQDECRANWLLVMAAVAARTIQLKASARGTQPYDSFISGL